jgi:hypothetical protein
MRFRFLMVAVPALALAGAFAVSGWHADAQSARPLFADNRPGAVEVDTELVLAVDVSYSMDPDEQQLQREGYIEALMSREFMDALRSGTHARIAVTYFEWAGPNDHKIIVPWRLIEGPETAGGVASEIARASYRRASRTSISSALQFARPLFDASGFNGIRRVIDVSGDGANNSGPFVTVIRDEIVAAGITINGLPIMVKRPNTYTLDLEDLDVYYEDCVIGGPGAFIVPIHNRDQFKEAIRTKLVMEVAGLTPQRPVVPVQARAPRVSCTIGEQMWRDRWGN